MLAVCLRWVGLALFVGAIALPRGVTAQTAWPSNDTGYRDSIRKALQEYQAGNWAEAKLYFSDAHAAYPNARTLRGLGLVAYAQRDYVDAIGYLESALVNGVQPLTPELRAQITKLLGQSRRFVARIEVALEPADAELRVDEQPAARTPDGSVWLNPGTHELVAMREGYESSMRRVSVEAGTTTALRLTLREERRPAELPPVERRPPARPAPLPAADEASTPVAAYLVIGVSAVVAATGGVLLGVALSDVGDLERPRPNTEWSAVDGKYRSTPPLSAAGIGMLGVGVAGVGAGLLWALWPEAERSDVAVSLAPSGVSLRGVL